MSDVAMPRLSDSMEEGTIIRWLIGEGASVERGQELVEIETDKASMTYEADASGVLHILAQEGDTLAVGAPIAQLLNDGEQLRTEPREEAQLVVEQPASLPLRPRRQSRASSSRLSRTWPLIPPRSRPDG